MTAGHRSGRILHIDSAVTIPGHLKNHPRPKGPDDGWRAWGPPAARSRNDLAHNLTIHVGQAEVPTTKPVRQPGVIQPQQMQDRRMQVVDVHFFLGREITVVVGGPVDVASLHPSPGHPHRETAGVVVAAVVFRLVLLFCSRCSPELSAPQHQGVVEQSPLLQILEQPGNRTVHFNSILRMPLQQIPMLVPVRLRRPEGGHP